MAAAARVLLLTDPAMAGHDPTDPASATRATPDLLSGLNNGVAGVRIGVVRHFHEIANKCHA